MLEMEISSQSNGISKFIVIVFASFATDFAPAPVEVFNNFVTTDGPTAFSTFSLAIAGITILVEISIGGHFQQD